MKKTLLYALAATGVVTLLLAVNSVSTPKVPTESSVTDTHGLWSIYDQLLKNAKCIDLTHTLTPSIPVWKGFGQSTFGPALNPETDSGDNFMKPRRDKLEEILKKHTRWIFSTGKAEKLADVKKWNLDKFNLEREDLFMDLDTIKPDMIEEAINGLIEKVKSNIQPDQLIAIFKNESFIETTAEIDFKHGDIVTHNGQVAFKLDFNISNNISLFLDRNGKLIKISAQI